MHGFERGASMGLGFHSAKINYGHINSKKKKKKKLSNIDKYS
jgi:hypothetical protein